MCRSGGHYCIFGQVLQHDGVPLQAPWKQQGKDIPDGDHPLYTNRTTADKLNVIDARWIDTETGRSLTFPPCRPAALLER